MPSRSEEFPTTPSDISGESGAHRQPVAEQTRRDALRIADQLRGLDNNTDPFVSAVRTTRMPMVITDPRQADNPLVFVNDAFCRLTGYSREEILGRNCRFLQGPETDPETVRAIAEAVRAVRSIEIDIRNHHKDGTPFWNRLLLAPVHDASGALSFFFASQMDVTVARERVAGLESRNSALTAELQTRLREQEENEARLRFATEAGRLGIWELDPEERTLTSSPLCREQFGRDPNAPFDFGEMVECVHPGDRARVREAVAEARRIGVGAGFDVDHRVVLPHGGVRWLQLRAQLRRGMAGSAALFIGTSLDVTARRETEARAQALLALDDRFRVLIRPDEVDGAVSSVLSVRFGAGRAGFVRPADGAALSALVALPMPDAAVRLAAGNNAVSDGGASGPPCLAVPVIEDRRLRAVCFVMPDLPPGGERHWSDDDVAFLREVAHRAAMVTARLSAEQALKLLAADLEREVAARTADLMSAEASLRQSQKMEAVGQLTGGIAHDFNNLLTGIGGSLELLRTRVAQGRTADLDRYITAAQGAAERAAALTHRLLAFSRRQTLEPKATEANALVNEMEELIRRTVGPAIEVSVAAAADLSPILVDPNQLENALLNLCINARDAMPDGGRLTIQTGEHRLDGRAAAERDLAPGRYVSVSVSDTGTGMSPDVIAKAFDPFFTTKPIGQGTGLGLSMIYGFAQQSGGQARIHSEEGRGTTVSLFLPRHDAGGTELLPAEDPGETPRAAPGETVLVVDDEPTVRMLACEVLRELGYEALEAADGPAALRILRSKARIDLLVTDVGLPGGMNGRQVADAARTLRPGLKVLFITGYAENAVLSHGHLEPGMHVITKPFAMELLGRRIRDLVGGR